MVAIMMTTIMNTTIIITKKNIITAIIKNIITITMEVIIEDVCT
jgi:hypothetical protein